MFRLPPTILGIVLLLAACGENMQTATLKTPPAAPPPPIRMWMVFFDTNSTALSPQASTTVSAAAAIAKTGPTKVEVSGFTDTEGNVAYNQALSVRRAASVRDALVGNGVPAQSIRILGEGETGLLVPTADQVKYPSNRRVQIVVQ
jgi:outer membrane protein OmpA-like peptidoglycan-associated protein